MGRLTFVDLAGSERLKETKSEGKTLQETGNINKSLYVLGKVISGMARENGAQSHRNVSILYSTAIAIAVAAASMPLHCSLRFLLFQSFT